MPDEKTKTLAGHMPAEKVGGVRVARKERRESERDNASGSEGSVEGVTSEEVRQAENVLANSGLSAQTKKDYPEAAVKQFHDKTIPKKQPHVADTHHNKASGQIFQPTKQ